MCSGRLHAPYVRAVVVRIRCGRWWPLPRCTTNEHQEDECRGEPAWQAHLRRNRLDQARVIVSDIADPAGSPISTSSPAPEGHGGSFDHFIGKIEHAWWHREAQRLGGFEVDDQ
jgi:hypothetical protein